MTDSSEDSELPRYRILIADDYLDGAESWAALLEIMGHQCRVAASGAEALAVFAEFSPHVMILDIAMPGVDGNEVARKIRAWSADTVLIAISGWARDADRHSCFAAGFNHYLQKPAEPEQLARLLSSLQTQPAG